jgi:hypothetical protein
MAAGRAEGEGGAVGGGGVVVDVVVVVVVVEVVVAVFAAAAAAAAAVLAAAVAALAAAALAAAAVAAAATDFSYSNRELAMSCAASARCCSVAVEPIVLTVLTLVGSHKLGSLALAFDGDDDGSHRESVDVSAVLPAPATMPRALPRELRYAARTSAASTRQETTTITTVRVGATAAEGERGCTGGGADASPAEAGGSSERSIDSSSSSS